MIDRTHDLSVSRQAVLLTVSRSSVYDKPRPVPAGELAIMRRIDALHLDYPFAGSRMLRDLLRGEGVSIGRALARGPREFPDLAERLPRLFGRKPAAASIAAAPCHLLPKPARQGGNPPRARAARARFHG